MSPWKINIPYSECVCQYSCVSYPASKAHAPCLCTVICGLTGCNIFFHIWKTERFSEKGKTSYWTQNVCFHFLYNFCLKPVSFWAEFSEVCSQMCVGLRVECPLLLSDFNETWIFVDRFSKNPQRINFHENPSSGSQTDITKLIAAFPNFSKAPKINWILMVI